MRLCLLTDELMRNSIFSNPETPPFRIYHRMALLDSLNRVIQLKTELDSLRPISREQEARIMQKFRLDWNFHSNHLEGNSLTYGETKALILFGITAQGKPLKDHIEMTGHDEAVKWIEDVVKEARPLTENFIRELNLLVLKEPSYGKAQTPDGQPTTKLKVPGQYKTQPNHVQTVTGEMFYFASPEETPAQMHDLMEWFRAKKNDSEANPVLLAAEFHYKFIRIHPFDDGNGRTARMLMNFILMQFGYPPVIIKTDDKQNYIAALRQADAGILEPFVEYIADNLIRSSELMIKGARGENIDDPDDLDKEIVLLEQRLKGVGEMVASLRDKKIITGIYENSIRRLISSFMQNAQKLDRLYNSSKCVIQFEDDNVFLNTAMKLSKLNDFLGKETEDDPESVIKSEEDLSSFAEKISSKTRKIHLLYKYRLLKNTASTFVDFGFEEEIMVGFEYHEYVTSTKGIALKKKYNEPLKDQEIDEIVKSETRRHLEAIEAKIKEIQNKK